MLETQLLPIPLDVGRNKKQDEKLVDLDYATEVENVDYSTIGTIKKATAIKEYAVPPQVIFPYTKGHSIYAGEDGAFALANPGNDNTFNTFICNGSDVFSNQSRGSSIIPVNFKSRISSSSGSSYDVSAFDIDEQNKIMITASTFIGANFFDIEIYNTENGARRVIRRELNPTTSLSGIEGIRVHCDPINKVFCIFFVPLSVNTRLDYICGYYNATDGSATQWGTIYNATNVNSFYSIFDGTNFRFFILVPTGPNFLVVRDAQVVTTTPPGLNIVFATSIAISVTGKLLSARRVNHPVGRFVLVYQHNTTINSFCVVYLNNSLTVLSQNTFAGNRPDLSAGTQIDNLVFDEAKIQNNPSEENFFVGITSLDYSEVRLVTINTSSFVITSTTRAHLGDTFICSEFVNSRYFHAVRSVGVNDESRTYSFIFCIRTNDFIQSQISLIPVARFNYLSSVLTFSGCNQVYTGDGFGVFSTCKYLSFDGASNQTRNAVNIIEIDYSYNPKKYNHVTIGGNILIPGGYLAEYNAGKIIENGFHHRPHVTASTVVGTGGFISAGTYSIRVVYEYIDANGNVSISEPSRITTVTVSSGSTNRIDLTVAKYAYGQKDLDGYYISVYRTVAGGSVFFLDRRFYTRGWASLTTKTVTISLISDNSTLQSRRQLYTTGGVLVNDPGPSMMYGTVLEDRLIYVGGEDQNEIFFSKPYLFGESVNMSLEFSIRTDTGATGGDTPITGLATLDYKIIVFKKNHIFYFQGNFPNELGQQYGLSQPILVSAEIGCINHKTIKNYPDGLIFQSEKGWYSLDRGLNVRYIGEGAEDFNEDNITSGVVLQNKNQIRYTRLNGKMLVYDYLVGKWFTRTNANAISSVVWDNKHLFLRPTSGNGFFVDADSGDGFVDTHQTTRANTFYSAKIETSWIKMSGVQNFGRVRRFEILGKFKSNHTLRVDVYYDYDNSYFETYNYTHNTANGIYQLKGHLSKQKCQAIKFVIYDTSQSGTGESMELTNLTLEVGIRKGMFKINPTKQV